MTQKLGGKTTIVVYARGSFYGSGSPTPGAGYDPVKPFMATWFRAIGLDDVGGDRDREDAPDEAR